ncbi:MAG: hypothetical protein RMA76_18925 [Deltaproteobacteria bacterium]
MAREVVIGRGRLEVRGVSARHVVDAEDFVMKILSEVERQLDQRLEAMHRPIVIPTLRLDLQIHAGDASFGTLVERIGREIAMQIIATLPPMDVSALPAIAEERDPVSTTVPETTRARAERLVTIAKRVADSGSPRAALRALAVMDIGVDDTSVEALVEALWSSEAPLPQIVRLLRRHRWDVLTALPHAGMAEALWRRVQEELTHRRRRSAAPAFERGCVRETRRQLAARVDRLVVALEAVAEAGPLPSTEKVAWMRLLRVALLARLSPRLLDTGTVEFEGGDPTVVPATATTTDATSPRPTADAHRTAEASLDVDNPPSDAPSGSEDVVEDDHASRPEAPPSASVPVSSATAAEAELLCEVEAPSEIVPEAAAEGEAIFSRAAGLVFVLGPLLDLTTPEAEAAQNGDVAVAAFAFRALARSLSIPIDDPAVWLLGGLEVCPDEEELAWVASSSTVRAPEAFGERLGEQIEAEVTRRLVDRELVEAILRTRGTFNLEAESLEVRLEFPPGYVDLLFADMLRDVAAVPWFEERSVNIVFVASDGGGQAWSI